MGLQTFLLVWVLGPLLGGLPLSAWPLSCRVGKAGPPAAPAQCLVPVCTLLSRFFSAAVLVGHVPRLLPSPVACSKRARDSRALMVQKHDPATVSARRPPRWGWGPNAGGLGSIPAQVQSGPSRPVSGLSPFSPYSILFHSSPCHHLTLDIQIYQFFRLIFPRRPQEKCYGQKSLEVLPIIPPLPMRLAVHVSRF